MSWLDEMWDKYDEVVDPLIDPLYKKVTGKDIPADVSTREALEYAGERLREKMDEKPDSEDQPGTYNPQIEKPSIFSRIIQWVEEHPGDTDWIETLGRQSLGLSEEVPDTGRPGSYPTAYVPEPGRRAYEAPPGEEVPKDGESIDDYIARTTREEKGARQERSSLIDFAKKSGDFGSEEKIPNPKSRGLINTGYVEKDGKRIYTYRKMGGTEDRALGDNESKITAFENSVIKQMGHDPRTLNPEAEAQKIVNRDKNALFAHIFGGGTRPADLTPAMRRHWESELNKYYNQQLSKFTRQQANDKETLKTLVARFEKEHLQQPLHVKEGDRVVAFNKATGKYEDLISGAPKKKDTVLPAHVSTEVEKLVERKFRPDADEGKLLMGTKVYDALPKDKQDEYDNVADIAKRFMLDAMNKKEPITAEEALKMALGNINKVKMVPAGTKLTKETAMAILKEANGDKNKARQIAKERGYSLADNVKNEEPPLPKSKDEAYKAIKARYPQADDNKIYAFIAKRFPNLK